MPRGIRYTMNTKRLHASTRSMARVFDSFVRQCSARLHTKAQAVQFLKEQRAPPRDFPEFEHDGLKYAATIEVNTFQRRGVDVVVIDVRLVNNGFLYPRPDELQCDQKDHRGHESFFRLREPEYEKLDPIFKFVEGWMGGLRRRRSCCQPFLS